MTFDSFRLWSKWFELYHSKTCKIGTYEGHCDYEMKLPENQKGKFYFLRHTEEELPEMIRIMSVVHNIPESVTAKQIKEILKTENDPR